MTVSVVTITGQAQTMTVMPSSTTTSSPASASGTGENGIAVSSSQSKSGDGDSFFDHTGKVAGVFTVVGVVGAALIGLLIFFLCRHRRRKQQEEAILGTPGSSADSPNAFIGGATSLQRDQSNATTLARFNFDEKGRMDNSTIVPITVDQRLDPGQVFMRWDNNDSRRSLQDEHDYSRKVLRVTNPDHRRNSSVNEDFDHDDDE